MLMLSAVELNTKTPVAITLTTTAKQNTFMTTTSKSQRQSRLTQRRTITRTTGHAPVGPNEPAIDTYNLLRLAAPTMIARIDVIVRSSRNNVQHKEFF